MVLIRSFLDPIEIVLDVLQNYLRFAWPKTFVEPYNRVKIPFLRIARFTGRQHVISGVGAFRRDRDEMFLNQDLCFVEQTGRIPAICATMMPIRQTTFPLVASKSGRQISFSGGTKLRFSASLFGMSLIIASVNFTNFIGIGFSPTPNSCFGFSGVGVSPLLSRTANLFWMRVSPSLVLSMRTFKTMFFHAIWLPFVLAKQMIGFPDATFATDATNGKGDIKHGDLSSSPLESRLGAASRIAVVRWFMRPSQAQLHYTTGIRI